MPDSSKYRTENMQKGDGILPTVLITAGNINSSRDSGILTPPFFSAYFNEILSPKAPEHTSSDTTIPKMGLINTKPLKLGDREMLPRYTEALPSKVRSREYTVLLVTLKVLFSGL